MAFAVDAVSFLFSTVCLLLLLPQATRPKATKRGQGILREAREGLGYVVGTRWLGITIAIAGLSNLAYFPTVVALPFLVKNSLHATVGLLGLYYSAIALGAVLGASWMGRFTAVRRRGIKSYAAWMLSGVALSVTGLILTPLVLLLAAMILGGANEVLSLIWVNSIQEKVPRELQGRVSSVDYLGSSLPGPAGYLVGGWVTPLIGPELVFILGGALQTLLIGAGLLHPEVRHLD
jgi:DHA3 family tetracycline resistance protein-like MFS transporter